MGKTIEELFRTKVLDNGQTAEAKYEIRNSKDIRITTSNGILNATTFPLVQKLRNSSTLTARLSEKFLEEEAVGLRTIRGLSSPVIYGTDIIRLKTRTTNIKTVMADAAAGGEGDNGIIGNAINNVKDKALQITSKLGIAFPETMIPTKISQNDKFKVGKEPDTMITLAEIKKDAAGNLVGKLLKDSIKGTPKQIANAAIGNSIQLVKDSVRKKLFGSRKTGGQNLAEQNVGEPTLYYSTLKYSSTIDASADDVAGRNDLSSVLKSRKELDKKLEKLGDTAAKIQGGLSNPPSIDKITPPLSVNSFASTKDKLKSLGKSSKEKLSGGRKEGQQKLAGKGEEVVSNPNVNTFDSEMTYPDTVDRAATDISLRNDLSTKLAALQEALNSSEGGITSGGPDRNEIKLYSTLKNEKKTSLLVQRGLTNVGDAINQKMPYDGESLTLGDRTLDDYDFIPLKFYSVTSKKTVQFRATISGLSETISPTWDSAKFLGSPFNHYTYGGVERSVQFNFKVYSMNVAEHIIAWEKLNFLTGLTYPIVYSDTSTYFKPPFIKFTLGNLYKGKECFIESLSYTIDDNTPWEVGSVGLPEGAKVRIDGKQAKVSDYKLPTIVDVAITLKFIESRANTVAKYGFIPVNLVTTPPQSENSLGAEVATIDKGSVPSNSPLSVREEDSRQIQRGLPVTQPTINRRVEPEKTPNVIEEEIQVPTQNESYESREEVITEDYFKQLEALGITN